MNDQSRDIGARFVAGARRILGDKLVGLYIYGAAAFPDDLPTGDVDFHVILTGPLTDDERSRLYDLHDALARDFPPLGVDMDGYYILLADARRPEPPQSQMWARATDTSWALHREHIRAGRVLALYGPNPREIYPPATWPELERALDSELQYVADHLQAYPDYCILQLCRLIYSYETGEVVVSKAQAAGWAREALPAWGQAIDLARKSYARRATEEDRQVMLAQVGGLLEFARERIERARQRRAER